MTAEKTTMAFGRRVYSLGLMALGLSSLAFREFDPGQSVPANFPARTALAYAAGAVIVIAAAAIQWRRTAAWGAAALTAYYALFVVFLMNGRLLLTHYAEYGTYENIAMPFAIAAGGLIVYAATANMDVALAPRFTRLSQLAFGGSSLVWGGAHFVYMNMTAPLVPKWLPPTQEFWGYATGIGFIVAGIAILTGIQARIAAILLTAMLASFALLVHEPILLANHSTHWNWSESALNLTLTGVAWVVADSLAHRRHAEIVIL
jgi:uncharacterized membrane protein YphA (DoxX/SURF4 family)